ncbi:MAG: ABC transporter permease [Treponema sp.]|nr:ABC transporter permease [Treponema sp.]
MFEDFIDALQNFRRNKTRTLLSLLGVIIGVASVIVITSMGTSSTQQIKDTFGSSGLDVVSISSGFMRRRRNAVSINFDESFREKLFQNVKNIKQIWYKNSLSATLSFGETSSTVNCAAVETGYLEMYGKELEYGRFINVTDDQEGCQKIILGHTIAQALFPAGDGEGKMILLTSNNISFAFEVIGVLVENSSGMEATDNAAYIPRGFYSKKIEPNPNAATVMVQATSPQKATELVDVLESYCENLTGTSYSVSVMSMQTMIEQMNSITRTMSVMLSAIAAISLLVGGIGIMNIMIVTVTERRQEIGIRKALGASPFDIRRQFLVESASITLIGGLAGIFLGIIISLAIEFVRSLTYIVNWPACIIAFVFSVFVGIFFGLNPAARAAKLDPVLALAGE